MRLFINNKEDVKGWHDWFAWFPVKTTHNTALTDAWVWLETVQRRVMYCRDGSYYEYRLK